MDILIFITVGSSEEYKFPRLLKIVDELCDEGIIDGNEVVAQIGYTEYEAKNFKTFDMTSSEEFKKLIEQSEIIITHAGTGSVISALKAKKKVIIFPRREEYGEHLDNHQLELADLFVQMRCVLCANSKEELYSCIEKINDFKPNAFVSNNFGINELIIEYINVLP